MLKTKFLNILTGSALLTVLLASDNTLGMSLEERRQAARSRMSTLTTSQTFSLSREEEGLNDEQARKELEEKKQLGEGLKDALTGNIETLERARHGLKELVDEASSLKTRPEFKAIMGPGAIKSLYSVFNKIMRVDADGRIEFDQQLSTLGLEKLSNEWSLKTREIEALVTGSAAELLKQFCGQRAVDAFYNAQRFVEEIGRLNQLASDLEQEVDHKNRDIKTLQLDLAAARRSLPSASTSTPSPDDALATVEYARVATELAMANREKDSLTEQLDDARSSIGYLEAQLREEQESSEATIQDLRRKLSKAELDESASGAEKVINAEEVNQILGALETLEESHNLRKQIDDLTGQLQSRDETIAARDSAVQAMAKQLAVVRLAFEHFKGEEDKRIDAAKKAVASEWRANYDSLKSTTESTIDSLQQEKNTLTEEVRKLTETNSALEAAKADAKAESERLERLFNIEKEDLLARIKDLEEENANLMKEESEEEEEFDGSESDEGLYESKASGDAEGDSVTGEEGGEEEVLMDLKTVDTRVKTESEAAGRTGPSESMTEDTPLHFERFSAWRTSQATTGAGSTSTSGPTFLDYNPSTFPSRPKLSPRSEDGGDWSPSRVPASVVSDITTSVADKVVEKGAAVTSTSTTTTTSTTAHDSSEGVLPEEAVKTGNSDADASFEAGSHEEVVGGDTSTGTGEKAGDASSKDSSKKKNRKGR